MNLRYHQQSEGFLRLEGGANLTTSGTWAIKQSQGSRGDALNNYYCARHRTLDRLSSHGRGRSMHWLCASATFICVTSALSAATAITISCMGLAAGPPPHVAFSAVVFSCADHLHSSSAPSQRTHSPPPANASEHRYHVLLVASLLCETCTTHLLLATSGLVLPRRNHAASSALHSHYSLSKLHNALFSSSGPSAVREAR